LAADGAARSLLVEKPAVMMVMMILRVVVVVVVVVYYRTLNVRIKCCHLFFTTS